MNIFDSFFLSKKNNKEKSEIEIIESILQWKIEEYSLIVDKYQNKIYKYVSKLTNIDHPDVENLVQEIFIKAFEKINSYNKKFEFSTWLYRIAHNHTIDNYKKKKIEFIDKDKETDTINIIENIIDDNSNIEKTLIKEDDKNDLYLILDELDIKYKEVLFLKFLEDKSYDEISDILEIPKWTVSTYINRAKKQFKKIADEKDIKFIL